MSATLTNQATKLASVGFDTVNVDIPRLLEIVKAEAKTKRGGMNFNAGVLLTKVCRTVKSLAGMPESGRVPENVHGEIVRLIRELPEAQIASAKAEGYNIERESAMRVKFDFRNQRIDESKTFTANRLIEFEKQLAHGNWEISQLKQRKLKFEDSLCESAEAVQRRDEKLAFVEKRLEQVQKLVRSIIAERDYQVKQTAAATVS